MKSDYPLSVTCVAGTQAAKVTANNIILFRMSNLNCVNPRNQNFNHFITKFLISNIIKNTKTILLDTILRTYYIFKITYFACYDYGNVTYPIIYSPLQRCIIQFLGSRHKKFDRTHTLNNVLLFTNNYVIKLNS